MVFFDSWLVELLVFTTSALFLYYLYFRRSIATFWSKRNVPHLDAKFLIGSSFDMGIRKSLATFFIEIYNAHKEKRILGMWSLHKPFITIFDREIIKNILTRDFSYFHDRLHMTFGEHDHLMNGNLFNLNGQEWRNMRVKLTPAFTTGKMKMMYPTMIECGAGLYDYILQSDKENLDLKDISARYTMNVIASCAFGIDTNALKNPNSDFVYYGKRIFSPTVPQIFLNIIASVFPFLGRLFKISQLPTGTTAFFINTVKDTIKYRKENNVQRKDIMQLLIQLMEKGVIEDADRFEHEGAQNDTKFTINEVAAQAFVFFSAGFETSSTTMTLAFYELARNKDVQKRLKNEIKLAMEKENEEICYETLTKLEFLECVIQETLRKYPIVPTLFRETIKDYYMPEFDTTIPAKTLVLIPSAALVQDVEFFPDPHKFDPERFLPERKSEIPSYCHMPFGEGPRSCIGNRFGLLQTKVGIVSILKHYTVEKCSKTPDPIAFGKLGLTLAIEGGLYFNLVKDNA